MSARTLFIPRTEFERVKAAPLERTTRLQLLADMCRVNTLSAVKRAGSGHLGSSFSAMDLVVWLYYAELNTLSEGLASPDRDIYFSSKGHDVPGFYAVLFSLGVIPEDKLLRLRRLGGLDGHPNLGIPGIEANSGSLGMGISKGRGMAWAKRKLGKRGRVFVMIGDGELQEGQNYEAFQAAAQQRVDNLVVIMDHNKVQTDKLVSEIVDLGDLEAKLRTFGWFVMRCDGHDLDALSRVFAAFREVRDRPKILIADTIKGKGVSFMEHPSALAAGQGLYQWHAGAPADEAFERAHRELTQRLESSFAAAGLPAPKLEEPPPPDAGPQETLLGEQDQHTEVARKVSNEFVAQVYGAALLEIADERPDIVVLDGDLSADCRVRPFEKAHPERFIENGIAEQDMVSMAGGLARMGLLPVVNSFASFLTARANEQIYNNATELTKIIYACHYAGLIPAGPGKSHQSLRDVGLLGTLPNMVIVQPSNGVETRRVVGWAVREATDNVAIRLAIGPSPRIIDFPADYELRFGQGTELVPGTDVALLAYGPVMLHEALVAHERLAQRGVSLRVIAVPWLNRTDGDWLARAVAGVRALFVLEDHGPVGALADHVLPLLVERRALPGGQLRRFAVEGYPACGTPTEALRHHGLDGASLARRIQAALDAS